MSSINTLPISFGTKYGLLISDSDVEFVSWKKGEFSRIAVFGNDEKGLSRFTALLSKNAYTYRNASFRVLTNIIGEDYRVERAAHLIGKYKTDYHNRRMQQLFRGVSLCTSFVQGRDERGRREDIVLFYGLLTEGKVLPWMRVLDRNPDFSVEALYSVSFVNEALLKKVCAEWSQKAILLMTMHEKGLLRQTHYDRGHVQFSRVSKISDASAEEVAGALRKELERTIQYLNSLKISIAKGLDIEFICPSNMVGQLRELLKSSEKIRFVFHDASTVAQSIGLTSAIEELGRDSSLSMHVLFSRLWIKQLASLNQVRYFWMKNVAVIAAIAFAVYGASGIVNASFVALGGVAVSAGNSDLTERRDAAQREYDEEFGQLEDPPSSANNITAISEMFRVLSNVSVLPEQLIYYFGQAFEKNKRVSIGSMRWYLTDNANKTVGEGETLVRGGDIYQILEVSGEFLPVPNESYINVASRADLLMESFEQRPDIQVQAVELPRRELVRENLGGVLTDDYAVDAARSRTFRLRIIWKKYDAQAIEQIRNRRT